MAPTNPFTEMDRRVISFILHGEKAKSVSRLEELRREKPCAGARRTFDRLVKSHMLKVSAIDKILERMIDMVNEEEVAK